MRKKRCRRGRRVGLLCVLCGLTALLSVGLAWLRPRLADYAENAVQYQVTAALEQAVSDAVLQEQAVASLTTLESGKTAALMTDAAAIEHIRAQSLKNAYDAINMLEDERLGVPVGTLVDPQFFAGLGPKLPFYVVGLGMVTAEIRSDFTDSGINQTKYCMEMEISAEIDLRALWCSRRIMLRNVYPLSEIVIVGDIPQVHVQETG